MLAALLGSTTFLIIAGIILGISASRLWKWIIKPIVGLLWGIVSFLGGLIVATSLAVAKRTFKAIMRRPKGWVEFEAKRDELHALFVEIDEAMKQASQQHAYCLRWPDHPRQWIGY